MPLAQLLDADRRWARAYAGRDGVVWVRRTPAYRPVWTAARGPALKMSFAQLEFLGRMKD